MPLIQDFSAPRRELLQYEDRSDSNKQMNALFNDGGYTDLDYYNEYPTIFHLRKALLHETESLRETSLPCNSKYVLAQGPFSQY